MNLFHRDKHGGGSSGGYVTAGSLGHTANGTPLDQVLYAHVRPDPIKWMGIPTGWDGHWKSPAEWADDLAGSSWGVWAELNGVEKPGQDAIDRTAVEYLNYAEKWGGFHPKDAFEITTYLHVPSPTISALPVRVWVDDAPDLTVEKATEASEAIRPPVVEEFTTETLGTGRKVTIYGTLDPEPGDLPGTQTTWVSVCYAFKVPTRQAVVTIRATDTDLGRMTGAAGDIDEFVSLINLHQAVPGHLPVPWSPPEQ
ncbi:MAG TPA: hypothetical protein VHU88_19640 [Sporichthyaceae bacterium]|jgi:hypothetical protein|nr:hypothetical protein [Sporichthyaceae bacterium]